MSGSNLDGKGFKKRVARKETLKACEAKYKAIFDSVNDAIFIHDPDTGAILEVNRKMTEMYGYTEDEARKITVEDFSSGIPPYNQEGAIEKLRTAIEQGGLLFEWHCKDKSGRLFWVEVNLKPTVIDGNLRVVATARDITKRKNAEDALRESEERNQAFFENTSEAIITAEPTGRGRVLGVNRAACTMFGYTEEEFIGLDREAVVEMDDKNAKVFMEHRDKTGQATAVLTYKCKDGSRFTGEMSSVIFQDRNGNMRTIAVIRDITERTQAEEKKRRLNEELEQNVHDRTVALSRAVTKLEEQRELLQTIIDYIPVIITLCNPAREIVLINKEFERLTGWSVEEAKTEAAISSCFPDPSYRKEVLDLVTKAEPGWREFDIVVRSGDIMHVSWAVVGLSDGSHIGIGIDNTERKKMEQDNLRQATAIEQAGEGIVLYNPEWVVEYVNPAYEKISGYSKEELVGKDVRFIHNHVFGSIQSGLPYQAASRGEIWRGNFKRMKKSGEVIDEHLTVSPVRSKEGEVINYVAVVQDTTQENRLQQIVIQSQKMEAIGSLAGGIAHDLKNIFTPILINSEMVIEDVGQDNPVYPLLEEILNAARTGGNLVKQIMTFSRRTPMEKVPVDMPSLVNETLSLLRSTIPATISIENHFNDMNTEVMADPTQIKQVLMNLGGNAAYAMKEHGGVLEVDVLCVDLDRDAALRISPDLASGSYVEIDVCDTGEGMDEETQQHIFEPFFTTKKGEGTGLGLAVVQGIAKGHQGAVNVWSRPGRGSKFKVLLPRLDKVCPKKND